MIISSNTTLENFEPCIFSLLILCLFQKTERYQILLGKNTRVKWPNKIISSNMTLKNFAPYFFSIKIMFILKTKRYQIIYHQNARVKWPKQRFLDSASRISIYYSNRWIRGTPNEILSSNKCKGQFWTMYFFLLKLWWFRKLKGIKSYRK